MPLSLDRSEDHFVLRHTDSSGIEQRMTLSAEDIVTLSAMVPTMMQAAFSMSHPLQNKSSLTPVAAMDVFDFRLQPEAMQGRLLLLCRLGSNGSSTSALAFLPDLANRLAEEIPPCLSQMRNRSGTKQ